MISLFKSLSRNVILESSKHSEPKEDTGELWCVDAACGEADLLNLGDGACTDRKPGSLVSRCLPDPLPVLNRELEQQVCILGLW